MKFNKEKFLALDPDKVNKRFVAIFLTVVFLTFNLFLSAYLFISNREASTGIANKDIDFLAYVTGAKILQDNPGNLYNINLQRQVQEGYTNRHFEGILSFRNTPITALMFVPFANMDKKIAYTVNYYLQTILALAFIFILFKTTKSDIIFLPLALIFFPSIYQQTNGQMMPALIGLTLVGIYYLFKTNRIFWAGVISAFLIFKIQFSIIIPFLFIFTGEKRKYLGGLAISSGVLLLMDSLLYRSFYFFDYIKFVAGTESYNAGTSLPSLYNLTAFLNYFGISYFYAGIVSAVLYVAILTASAVYRRKFSFEKYFAAAVLLSFSLTLHSQLVDLILLLIPIFLISKWWSNIRYILILSLFTIPLACLFSKVHFQGLAAMVMFLIGNFILWTDSQRITVKTGIFSIFPE